MLTHLLSSVLTLTEQKIILQPEDKQTFIHIKCFLDYWIISNSKICLKVQ